MPAPKLPTPKAGVVTDPLTGDRWIRASCWHLFHSYPTPSGLRWLIFRASERGFERVIRRVGRSILLNEAEFFRWLRDHNSPTP